MARQEDEREVVRNEDAEDKDEVEAHQVREQVRDQRNEEDREARTEAPDFEAHRKSH
jgi:hypothetical protein